MIPWTAAWQASLSFTISQSLLKFVLVILSNHLNSVGSFSSCLQSFPASGSFPMSQFFTSGGQSIRASASVSVLPMNTQSLFPLELTDLISLLFKGLSRVFSSTIFESINSSALSLLYELTLTSIYDYWKNHIKLVLTTWTFVCKVMPLLFNMLSSFIIFSINIVYRFNNSDLLFTGPWILPITHSCETIGLSVRSVLLIQSLSTYYWLSNTGWAIHLFQLKKQNSSAVVVFLKHLRSQYIQLLLS